MNARRHWLGVGCLFFAFFAFVAGVARAAEPVAIPALPPTLLVDQVGALSATERALLEQRLRAIQDSGRAQAAIFITDGTHGEALAPFALRVAEAWQLGRAGRNDGLLVLVIPSLPAARFEVGYGLEGDITDALASQWLDELLPAIKQQQLGAGLNRVLDQIDVVLPKNEVVPPPAEADPLDAHPEWKLPFVLLVFSPLTLAPLLFGRSGSVASGVLFAVFLGGATLAMWNSLPAALTVAGTTLPLPFLWRLNWAAGGELAPWVRVCRAIANLIAVGFFFAVVSLFVGLGLLVSGTKEVWMAPLFAGLLAIGVAVFLFPGRPAEYLLLILRSATHFCFILACAYFAFGSFVRQPTAAAFITAALLTALVALALYLESRERRRGELDRGARRWSLWVVGLTMLVMLPLGLLALLGAVVGDTLQQQFTLAMAGGSSLTGAAWFAVRTGLTSAVKVGLGGLFGGGGAGRVG